MSKDTQNLKSLWQSLPSEKIVANPALMRQRAEKFQSKNKRRDMFEYVSWAALFILVIYMLTLRADWKIWVTAGLVIMGSAIAVWNYYRRKGHKSIPEGNSNENLVDFMRHELTRQRDSAASTWRWYLLPLMPGALFIMGFRWLEEGSTILELTQTRVFLLFAFAFLLTSFGAYILWQFLCAARYQRQLDELDRYCE